MTHNDHRKQVQTLLADMAVIYRDEKATSQHIKLWAELLLDHSIEDLRRCSHAYCKDPANTWFPIPVTKILKYLDGPKASAEDLGVVTAAKVLQAVSKFGSWRGEEAREFMGELGSKAVSVFGGWAYVCEHLGVDIDVTTFQAQIRRIVETETRLVSSGMGHLALDSKPNNVTQINGGLQKVNVLDLLKKADP